MEQSANPTARVGHYTRAISTRTQNASVWSLTAVAPSDSVLRALCTNSLTYLLDEKMGRAHAFFGEKIREKREFTIMNHATPKLESFDYNFVADIMSAASVRST